MRIHSGRLKGRDIPPPPGTQTRPTTDVVKESMFSVIDHTATLIDAVVLDIFAGSGQLSWEALSRGARSATLIDASAAVCRHLRSVAVDLGVSDVVTIIRTDALEYVRHGELVPPSIVFIDPPYQLRCCNMIVGALVARDILPAGALLAVEHGDQEALLPQPGYRSAWHRERSATVVDILVRESIEP